MNAIAVLVGRILLGLIFLLSGLSKIGDFSGTVKYMVAKGIPAPEFFLFAAILVELICSISVMSGYRAKFGALVLALFLVPVTYLFHFRAAMDGNFNVVDQMQMIATLKNLSIMGGLLFLSSQGPGPLSVGKS